jgi:membrane protease YdiL (CAAX protease family)
MATRVEIQLLQPRPAGWGALLVAMVLPAIAAYAYFVLWAGGGAMPALYAASKVVQFSLPLLWLWSVRSWPPWRGRPRVHGALPALAFGVLAAAAVFAMYYGWLRGSPLHAAFAQRLGAKLRDMHCDTPARFLALATFLSLAHSFLEEYYWRWFVYGNLRRHISRHAAMLLSGAAFAAHHVIVLCVYIPPGHLPLVALFSAAVAGAGVAWAALYERHDSVFAVWASHLLVDVALMSVGYAAAFG